MISQLINDIEAAEHHVHMLFYIFANDETGRRVAEALVRAEKRRWFACSGSVGRTTHECAELRCCNGATQQRCRALYRFATRQQISVILHLEFPVTLPANDDSRKVDQGQSFGENNLQYLCRIRHWGKSILLMAGCLQRPWR